MVESNLFPIRRPEKSFGKTELLFINPVARPVDDVVSLSIESDLFFFPGFEVFNKDVVVSDKSYFGTIGREIGQPLFPLIGKWCKFSGFCIPDIVIGNSGMDKYVRFGWEK